MHAFFAATTLGLSLAAQDPRPSEPDPIRHVPVPVGVPIGVPVAPGAGTSAPIHGSSVTTSIDAPSPDPSITARPLPGHPTRVTPRIRDVTQVVNGIPHLVTGVGVVAGLEGTGASDRSTRQAILNFIRENGLQHSIADVGTGNTALVALTAEVPLFAKEGDRIPVKVEVISDATSLRGGHLLRAELRGVDGQSHVVVQGSLDPGGVSVQGGNASVQKNLSTTAVISSGGYVIRPTHSSYYSESGALELRLDTPTMFNAASVAEGCRSALAGEDVRISIVDATMVRVTVPADSRTHEYAVRLLNRIGNVAVEVENPVRVVIDQSTGAVVAGEGLMISPCVIGLTDLMIAVVEDDEVVQPTPLSGGDTQRIGRTRIDVQTSSTDLKPVAGGATVADLLQNLKTLGLTTQQLVAVFLTLKKNGFLHAELIVE